MITIRRKIIIIFKLKYYLTCAWTGCSLLCPMVSNLPVMVCADKLCWHHFYQLVFQRCRALNVHAEQREIVLWHGIFPFLFYCLPQSLLILWTYWIQNEALWYLLTPLSAAVPVLMIHLNMSTFPKAAFHASPPELQMFCLWFWG